MDLGFEVVECRAEPHAAAPTLMAKVRITESSGVQIHAIAMKCQIRIEPQRRRYSGAEEERLFELFGEPKRWGDTLKNFLWTHVSFMVPSFRDRIDIDVPIPCSYDFEIAGAKYFQALEAEGDGVIPLVFLFNGTVFSKAGAGSPMGFSVGHVPWDKEASYRLPVSTWRKVMDLYFPNTAWLRVRHEVFNALSLFKARQGLPTWEETISLLLARAGAEDLVPANDPADRLVWPKPPPQGTPEAAQADPVSGSQAAAAGSAGSNGGGTPAHADHGAAGGGSNGGNGPGGGREELS
jgi:hypothetical protein